MTDARSLRVISTPRGDRMRALRAELQALGGQQLSELLDAMDEVCGLAVQVAENPDQKPGVRDLARRVAEDLPGVAATITAISGR